MADLSSSCLRKGCLVRLAADDGHFQYSCTGIVHEVNHTAVPQPYIRLRNCKDLKTGKEECSVQKFVQSEICELFVLEDTTEEKETVVKMSKCDQSSPTTDTSPGKQMVRHNMYRENKHLRSLHAVNMPDLLNQVQISPPPSMNKLERLVGKPRILPVPDQDPEHMEGDKFKNRFSHVFKTIRSIYWKDERIPPELTLLPQKLYVITDVATELFDLAMEEIGEQNMIGVSLEGQKLGRKGKLSLLVISTPKSVFLFDVLSPSMEHVCFDRGLRQVLENPGIMKVFHDVRLPSDLLYHQYGIVMKNVSDTLGTHCVFMSHALFGGFMPKYAVSLPNMCRAYLGIKGKDLFFPHYRQAFLDKDTAIWLERPLKAELEIGAVRNVMYLLDLHIATRACAMDPFRKSTEFLMSYVKNADDSEAAFRKKEVAKLPETFLDCLPKWRPNAFRAEKSGVIEKDNRWVHNFVGQTDPFLIFSRDCMHQKKP